MFKKALFIAALSTAIVTSGLVTGASASATLPAVITSPKVFDLSALDAEKQELALSVLSEFDFAWKRLQTPLLEATGRRAIRVQIRDLANWKALGLTWDFGTIQIDDDVNDPYWFQRVFRHELGHVIDLFVLAPQRLHRQVALVYGSPWKEIWHDFNDGFTAAASTTAVLDADHPLTEQQVLQLRAILSLSGPVPEKVELAISATPDWHLESS